MKHLLFLAIIAMFAPTTDSITEEIFLNEDGSGKYNVYSNQVPVLAQLKMQEQGISDEVTAEKAVWKEHSSKFQYSNSAYQEASTDLKKDPLFGKLLKYSVYFTIGNKSTNTINTGVMCKFDNLEELAILMELYRTNPSRTFDSKPVLENNIQLAKENKSLSIDLPATNAPIATSIYMPSKIRKIKGKAKKDGQKVELNSTKKSSLVISWK